MKRKIIVLVLFLSGMTIFAQSARMSYYSEEFSRLSATFIDRLEVLESVRDANLTGIGDFYHDETKLTISWMTNHKKPEIAIDEPFGLTWQRPERPLHPANWTGLFENDIGLVFQHRGTPKSWVIGNTYSNLIAWGANNFNNRMHNSWFLLNRYDMRLDRHCHYDYSVFIAENRNITAIARQIGMEITPLIAVRCDELMEEKSFIELKNNNLIVTAVEDKGDVIAVRAYNASDKETIPEFNTSLNFISKTNIAGLESEIFAVKPFEIFELNFK